MKSIFFLKWFLLLNLSIFFFWACPKKTPSKESWVEEKRGESFSLDSGVEEKKKVVLSPFRKQEIVVGKGDTILGILQEKALISPFLLVQELKDELAEFVDLRAIRPGHIMTFWFSNQDQKLRKILYHKNPIHEWELNICWKGDSCYELEHPDLKKDGKNPLWLIETEKKDVQERLTQETIQVEINSKTPTFTQALLAKKEKSSLAFLASQAFGHKLNLGAVFGKEKLNIFVEKVHYKEKFYGYNQIKMFHYQDRNNHSYASLFYIPSKKGGQGMYFADGTRSSKEHLFRLPVSPFRVSSRFGWRFHPIYRRKRMHWGVDTRSGCGQPIFSIASGKVITRGWRGGAGKMVSIRHEGGWVSRYFHLSRYAIRPNARLKKGQRLGYVGTTGASTGCHLHFELLKKGRRVNPLGFLHASQQKNLSCSEMKSFWKVQVGYCKQMKLSGTECSFYLPERCARVLRKDFQRVVSQYCFSVQQRCPFSGKFRSGFYPKRASLLTAISPKKRRKSFHKKKIRKKRQKYSKVRFRNWKKKRKFSKSRFRKGKKRRYRKKRWKKKRNRRKH